MRLLLCLAVILPLHGCATAMVTGAVVGTTAKVAGAAVKGTAKAAVGTGKLVYRGGKAVAGIGADETVSVGCDDIPPPKPQTCLAL